VGLNIHKGHNKMTSQSIIDNAKHRHTAKAYDPSKTISDCDMERVLSLLQLSPSSVNLQPWHFVVTGTSEGKDRVAKSTDEKYPFNSPSIRNASHAIVFCSRIDVDEDYQFHITAQEEIDGRFGEGDTQEGKAQRNAARKLFVDLNRGEGRDIRNWMQKQVYLNMGAFLLGVAALGINATPMEGVDTDVLNNEFDLKNKGFEALAVVTIGYNDADKDYNATLPKSRLPIDEIITTI